MLDLIKEDESDLWSMTLFEDFDPDYGTTVTQIGNVELTALSGKH